MKLDFGTIEKITVGSVKTDACDGGVGFFKYTDNGLAAWEGKSATLGTNAKATTGIHLYFHTNSQNIGFKVINGGKYEIKVDGLSRACFVLQDGESVDFALCAPLGEKQDEYRVTLVLPSHGKNGVFEYIELDDGATVEPHKFDRKFLFIGDSITQGYGSFMSGATYVSALQ